jgi:hypothetical protein
LLAAAVTLGCGSTPEALPPATTPRTLQATPTSISLRPGEQGTARFQLFGPSGAPLPNTAVTFAIVDNPDTPGQEAQGATLVSLEATSNAQGFVETGVLTGKPTSFTVRATSANAVEEVTVVVTALGKVGAVEVAPFYVSPAGWAATHATTIEIRFYDNLRCADIPLRNPPRTTRRMGATYLVDTTIGHAALARARLDRNVVLAIGCTDVPGPTLVEGNAVQVAVPMVDVGPDPAGRYAATSELSIAPPLAAAEELAAVWRDLTDCPLDPAQRWLDCTIDALGPTSNSDPLDCVPATAPGGDGPLGDELGAMRGAFVAGPDGKPTSCRGSKTAQGALSADALVQGLFGSPLPLPIVRLEAAANDAAHLFDDLKLRSTLDLRAEATITRVDVTHTLTDLVFGLPGASTEVALQPLGLPSLSVATAGTLEGEVLVIDQHGFTVRLGTAARSAFGTLGLARRGLPPDAPGLVAAIAALAHTDDGALAGCAALDATFCSRVSRAPGCLVAACGSGLDALATRLSRSFEAADGVALDLYLAGRTPLLDTHGNGLADKLGDLQVPAMEGTWTADLRPRGGRRTITARWEALRQGN